MRSHLYYLCLLAVYAAASPLHTSVELSRRDSAPTPLALHRHEKNWPEKRAPAPAQGNDDDDGDDCADHPATKVVTKVVPVTATKTRTRPVTATSTTSRTKTFYSTSTATKVVTKKVGATTSTKTTKTTSKPKPSSTSAKPTKAATTTLSTLVTPIPTSSNYVFTGMSTWYYTGLGACGWWSNDGEMVAAVPDHVYDNFPGATPWWDTNGNPVCGNKINLTWEGKTIQVTVVDRCVGCETYQIDLSPTAFGSLTNGNLDQGVMYGITWQWA